MSPDVRKVRDTGAELRFAYPHRGAWAVVLAGGALAFVGLEVFGGWILAGFGLLLAFLGLGAALQRTEITVDLGRRRFRYRRGYWPSPEEGEGSVDDLEVVLKKELERKGSEQVEEWEVELAVRGWPRTLEIAEIEDEATARREAEELAARLGVPLRERTGT